MIERRDDATFAFEATAEIGVGGEVGTNHLDGDRALQTSVASAVDLTHATRAEFRHYLVRPQPGADCKQHKRASHRFWGSNEARATGKAGLGGGFPRWEGRVKGKVNSKA